MKPVRHLREGRTAHPAARALLGIALVWFPLLPQAIGQLSAGSPAGNPQPPALLRVTAGEAAEAHNQLYTAEADYRAALATQPDSVVALVHLASVLEKEERPAAAITFWKQASHAHPSDTSLSASLAEAYLANQQNQEALALLQRLSQLPNDQALDKGAVWLNLGTAFTRLDRYQEAAASFRKALSFQAYAGIATTSLAKALITLGEDADALTLLQAFVTANGTNAEAHTLLGIALENTGQLLQAEAQLRRAAALTADAPDFETQYHLGTLLHAEQKQSEAIESLRAAVALQPDSQKAHFQLARAFRASHQLQAAAEQEQILARLRQAQTDRMQVTVLGSAAAQAEKVGDLVKATQLYQQIAALAPDDDHIAYNLALIYEKQRNRSAERAILQEAAARQPSIALIHSQLGFLDAAEGDRSHALAELETALRQDPQCVEALGNLGVLRAQMGQLDEAARYLELAVESDPGYEKGYVNLGLVLAAQGRQLQATAALRQATALRPDDAAALRALQALGDSGLSHPPQRP